MKRREKDRRSKGMQKGGREAKGRREGKDTRDKRELSGNWDWGMGERSRDERQGEGRGW